MSVDRTRPSAVILDMLRSARSRRRSAQALIAAGELFGIAENTIRVTLSRLMARGIIESPQRGLYRLSEHTDALNDFVERWRLGEQRVRPWQPGTWLLAHVEHEPAEASAAGRWALEALGFRAVRSGLYARPDNLNLSAPELRNLATGLGLDTGVLLMSAGAVDASPHPEDWREAWQPAALDDHYRDALARLRASAARLPTLPIRQARLECFTLGGEMIHRLAKDPLLPGQWVDTGARAELWRAMLAYDRQGKAIWAGGREDVLHQMPRPQLRVAP